MTGSSVSSCSVPISNSSTWDKPDGDGPQPVYRQDIIEDFEDQNVVDAQSENPNNLNAVVVSHVVNPGKFFIQKESVVVHSVQNTLKVTGIIIGR